jgi:hypothetical protein
MDKYQLTERDFDKAYDQWNGLNKDKTVFAKEVVPTLDGLWFEPFRPIFEFIKSKCVGGVAP